MSFGAREIPRHEFMRILKKALKCRQYPAGGTEGGLT